MKISVTCLFVNLIFAAALVFPLKQGGLGIANTASALVNVFLLSYALRQKTQQAGMGRIARRC